MKGTTFLTCLLALISLGQADGARYLARVIAHGARVNSTQRMRHSTRTTFTN